MRAISLRLSNAFRIDSEARARAVHTRVVLLASLLMAWAILLVCSLTSHNWIVGLGWY